MEGAAARGTAPRRATSWPGLAAGRRRTRGRKKWRLTATCAVSPDPTASNASSTTGVSLPRSASRYIAASLPLCRAAALPLPLCRAAALPLCRRSAALPLCRSASPASLPPLPLCPGAPPALPPLCASLGLSLSRAQCCCASVPLSASLPLPRCYAASLPHCLLAAALRRPRAWPLPFEPPCLFLLAYPRSHLPVQCNVGPCGLRPHKVAW